MTTRHVEYTDKSFPAEAFGRPIEQVNAPLAAFSTPLFTVDARALEANIALLAGWAADHGLEIMPHGKTTMAPELWRRQIAAGATGITVATGWQAEVALRAGLRTVLIANECTDERLLERLAGHLAAHPDQELVVWVDSSESLERVARASIADAPIGVLIELGAPGGRTGIRAEEDAVQLAEVAARLSTVRLVGVAGYEGALAHDRVTASTERVRAYCDALVSLLEKIRPLIDGTPWITAGGSAYFDIVADAFAEIADARAIIRSGAYLVHDSGFYRSISPLDDAAARAGETGRLQPAMFAFARVVSLPEPGLALLDAGKRDVPFDEGLPTPISVASDLGGEETPIRAEITALNDQHTFLRWEGEAPVRIGEVVRLGLSHPCTAFDKWRLVPIVDYESGIVREAIETFF